MKKRKEKISIVFPAFNEEGNIGRAVFSAKSFASRRFIDYEVIVVNDGSCDSTGAEVQKIARKNRKVRLINHQTNLGYGAAVWDGLKAAKGDLVFFTDSDLQFDIAELKKFLPELKNYEVVVGYRVKRRDSLIRLLNMWGWKQVCRLMLGIKVKDVDCAFKLFRREVLKGLNIQSLGATFSAELLYRLRQKGCEIKEIPVKHYPRKQGSPTGAKISVIARAFGEIWRLYKKDKKLVSSRSFFIYALAVLALFASRIFFASNSRDFFDSSQYSWRAALSSLKEVMISGHPPFHPLYNLFSAVFYKLGMAGDGVTAATLPSVFFGSASIIVLFLLIRKLFDGKTAWLTAVLYSLIPFVWISQITILTDATEHFFYFLSLYFWVLGISSRGGRGYFLSLFAGLSFGLAGFAHTQVALWGLGLLAIIILTLDEFSWVSLKTVLKKIFVFCLGGGVFIFAYLYLLIAASQTRADLSLVTYKQALSFLLFGNLGDHLPISLSAAKSYFLILVSTPLAFLTLLGAIKMWFVKRKEFWALSIWLVPAFLFASSYIYENLHGRALLIGLVPILIFAAFFILSCRARFQVILIILVVIQLLVLSLPAVWCYHMLPSPNESLAELQKESESGGTFIASHTTKTWANYDGTFVNFADVGFGTQFVKEKATESFKQNKPVYISSDAIFHPFRRYDGLYYDLRSFNVGGPTDHGTLLGDFFNNYNIFLTENNSYGFNQSVYRVVEGMPDDFLNVADKTLENSDIVFGRIKKDSEPISNICINVFEPLFCGTVRENITRFDAGYCLKKTVFGQDEPTRWSFSDKDGWFFVPMSDELDKIVLGFFPSQTKLEDSGARFIKKQAVEVVGEEFGSYSDLTGLKKAISDISGSFYVVGKGQGERKYRVYLFDFDLPLTNRLEAEDLSGECGEIKNITSASGGKVRSAIKGEQAGYLASGPYIDLDAGKYKVAFALRSKKSKDANVVIDISSDTGRVVHCSKNVPLSEIYSQDFVLQILEFETSDLIKGVEFRTEIPQNSAIELDFIELEEL